MAYEHDGTSGSYLTGATGALAANANAWTIMAWVRPDDVASYRNLWYVSNQAIQINPSGQWEFWDGATAHVFGTAVAGQWQHVCVSRSSATAAVGYVDGVATALTPASSSLSGTQYIGTWAGTDDFWDGRIAALKAWSSALSASEVAGEMELYRPKTVFNVRSWYPMLRGDALADLGMDHSAQGRTLTIVGTPTASEDNPPVSWGAATLIVPVVAVGGTTESGSADLSATGTLAAAASATRTAAASLAASGTLSATASASVPAAASLSATGTLAASAGVTRATSAALSGSGTLVAGASASRGASASLSATGTLAAAATTGGELDGAAALSAAGSLAAAATVTREAAAGLTASGGVTAAATATRGATAALAGSGTVTAAGTRTAGAAATLAALSTLDATARRTLVSSATLAALETLAAAATVRGQQLPGTTTLTLTTAGSATLALARAGSAALALATAGTATLTLAADEDQED